MNKQPIVSTKLRTIGLEYDVDIPLSEKIEATRARLRLHVVGHGWYPERNETAFQAAVAEGIMSTRDAEPFHLLCHRTHNRKPNYRYEMWANIGGDLTWGEIVYDDQLFARLWDTADIIQGKALICFSMSILDIYFIS